jgi:hypothetical protein
VNILVLFFARLDVRCLAKPAKIASDKTFSADSSVLYCLFRTGTVVVQVRSLLGELAMVEDEIFYLEKKVDDLRLRLHRKCNDDDDDRRVALEHRPTPPQQRDYLRQPRRSGCGLGCRRKGGAAEQLPRLPSCPAITDHDERESEASVRSASVKGNISVHHCILSLGCSYVAPGA